MNEKLFNVKLSLIPPHNTRYDRVYAPLSTLYSPKNDILDSWLIVCCKLSPALARQMWRHRSQWISNFYIVRIYLSLGIFTAIVV